MQRLNKNNISTAVFTVALFFFIITFSIGLPIYFRPFYFWHIGPLELAESSGFTVTQIKAAYNDVLNYLTMPGYSFAAGDMKYSAEGAAHFADCKELFSLNFAVLITTALILIILLVLQKKGKIGAFCIAKKPATLYASGIAAGIVVLLGILISVDFNKAFEAFHSIFFVGKSNWMFDDKKDQIINVLPKQFFADCAILICASIILFALVFFTVYIKRKKHKGC